ncbi:MAG: biopolymer transporter ExbD [Planctomycetota bacterium]
MTTQKKIKYEEASMDLQMAPMIDVVFQLIIFFMCSIHFKSLEGKLLAQLPLDKGMGEKIVTSPILTDVRIKLIYSENEPLLTKVKIGSTDFSDMNSLYKHLRNMEFITLDGDVIPVKIDADGKVPAQSVVSVLDICKRAGVPKTEFAAKTPIRSPPK